MKKKITIITKPNCPPCNTWKNVMKQNGISYSEVDIRDLYQKYDRNANVAIAVCYKQYGSAMPIILINDKPKFAGAVYVKEMLSKLKEWGVLK